MDAVAGVRGGYTAVPESTALREEMCHCLQHNRIADDGSGEVLAAVKNV